MGVTVQCGRTGRRSGCADAPGSRDPQDEPIFEARRAGCREARVDGGVELAFRKSLWS